MFSVQLSSVLQQTKKTCTVSTVLPSIFFSTTYSIPIRVHLHVKLHVYVCILFFQSISCMYVYKPLCFMKYEMKIYIKKSLLRPSFFKIGR